MVVSSSNFENFQRSCLLFLMHWNEDINMVQPWRFGIMYHTGSVRFYRYLGVRINKKLMQEEGNKLKRRRLIGKKWCTTFKNGGKRQLSDDWWFSSQNFAPYTMDLAVDIMINGIWDSILNDDDAFSTKKDFKIWESICQVLGALLLKVAFFLIGCYVLLISPYPKHSARFLLISWLYQR